MTDVKQSVPSLQTPSPTPAPAATTTSTTIPWHQFLVAGFVVGVTVWVVEQKVSPKAGFILAIILLLGVMYVHPDFVTELKSIAGAKW